jgi:hypothetical protein
MFRFAAAKIDKAQEPNLPDQTQVQGRIPRQPQLLHSIANTKFVWIGDYKLCPYEIHDDKARDEDRGSREKRTCNH